MNDFQVWASLGIKGNALEQMEKFSKLTTKAFANLEKLEKALGVISPSVNKLSRSFQLLTARSIESTSEMALLSKTLTSASMRTNTLAASTARLARNLEVVATKGALASKSLGAGSAMGSGAIRAGAGVASGLGGMAMGAAVGVGYLAYAGFEKQKEFQQQVMQLRGGGLTEAQIQEAQRIAYTPTKGISSIDKISALNDAFMASRNWNEAKILAPILAEAKFAGNATFKNMTDQQEQALVKFAEMRAGSDMSKIPGQLDLGYKIMNASSGTIDPKQLATFMRRASSAGYHLTDRGFAGLEPIMQELTPTITGTGYQTGFQMLATGAGTLNNKRRVADLIKLGVYTGGQKDSSGRYTSTQVNPEFLNLYQTDLVGFTKKLLTTYAAHGTTSSEDIVKRLALDLPNTTARMVSTIVKNMSKVDRELLLYDNQPGIQSSFQRALNIPTGVSETLSKSWSSMATAFGKLSSPAVVEGMKGLTWFLDKLTRLFTYMNASSKVLNTRQSGNIDSLTKASPLISGITTSPVITKDGVSAYTPGYYGQFSKSVMRDPHESAKNMQVNLHVDGKKMAQAIIPSISRMMNNGGTISGTSNVNTGLGSIPTAYNRAGSF